MRSFIKLNPWFFAGFVLVVLTSLLLVHVFGFWGMHKTITIMPERLRDMTFPVWDKFSFLRHGFLVFLTKNDFYEGVAYSNNSTAYLLFMYPFYKIEMLMHQLPMRVVVAYIEMIFYVTVIGFILFSNLKQRLKFDQAILILLAVMFLVTMPDFWISAGKFNVDNPFRLQFPLLLLIAFLLSRGEFSGIRLWIPLGIFCILAPISAALLGFFLAVSSIKNAVFCKKLIKLSLAIIFISVTVYLQPVLTSKILGFSSSNSSWIFRAGLDGDVSSFNNAFNSVLQPFYPRPMYLILVPLSLLLLQLALIKLRYKASNDIDLTLLSGFDLKLFYGILFSQYLITLLLWPQAVSIHPYLYDFMLVGPIYTLIVFNFAWNKILLTNTQIWIWVMLFFISFNLQQITQADRCFYCFYPSWVPNQYVIKP